MKKRNILLSGLFGLMVGICVMAKIMKKKIQKIQTMSDKHLALFLMMNKWVKVKQEGKSLVKYMEQNGYQEIAIYGMSYVGECLLNELKNSNIVVKYGIDKNKDGVYTDIDVFSIDDTVEEVDAVIVTSIFYINEVKKELFAKFSCPIISLEYILNEI